MSSFRKIKNYLYRRESGRWLISFFLILIFYAILFQYSVIRFGTNDDNTIINSIISFAEQPGDTGFMYINYFLGVFLAFLYRNIRTVPWYDIYSVMVLIFSGVIIFKSILKAGYRADKNFGKIIFLLAVFFMVMLAPAFQQVQFTTTAAAAGTAALVNFLCVDQNGRVRILDLIITWLLFHISMFQREMVGYVILAFFLLVIGVNMIRSLCRKKNLIPEKGNILFALFLIASLFLTIVSSNYFNVNTGESEEFERYSDLRVRYMDYNVQAYLTYPEIFEEVGWDEELCAMVSSWYFMDQRYNAETLEKILEVVDQPSQIGEGVLQEADSVWKDLVRSEKIVQFELLFLVLLLVGGLAWCLKNKREETVWNVLVILGSCLGCAVLLFYLCLRGRLPLRVFESIMLPAASLVLPSSIQIQGDSLQKTKGKRAAIGISLAGLILLTVPAAGMLTQLFDRETQEVCQEDREKLISMKQYALQNRNNVYIYDESLTGGEPIFYRTTDNTVYNCFFWGGTSMFSQSYYTNLEKNGLEDLHSEDWFRDNVYYLTHDSEMIYVLKNYLESVFDNVDFEIIQTIGNIVVVKYTR